MNIEKAVEDSEEGKGLIKKLALLHLAYFTFTFNFFFWPHFAEYIFLQLACQKYLIINSCIISAYI